MADPKDDDEVPPIGQSTEGLTAQFTESGDPEELIRLARARKAAKDRTKGDRGLDS